MQNKILFFINFLFVSIGLLQAQNANWTAVLPNMFPTNASGQINGISRVSQMKFHTADSLKMYAISARGGLFITADGGNNWTVTPGTDFMSSQRLASVCVDYTNNAVIYLGTGDHDYYYNGTGVWKSVNGGQTFTQTTLTSKLVVDMIMDPINNNVIVAATNAGIFKTTDGGNTWTLKSTNRKFDDLQRKTAANSRTLFASTTDTAFFRSTDFGDTWTQINTGITLPTGITNGNGCRIGLTPADTNIVYFGMVGNGGMLYKSTNGGSSFTAIKTTASPYITYYSNASTDVGQGDYNYAITVDRINPNIIYVVAHAVWKSTDGGLTWTQLTNWWEKVHTDMHQIICSPFNNNKLWNVNDGGIWLSTDGGNNWAQKSNGINGYEIYHGNCSPTRRDMISIGTQDNGELYSVSSGWLTNRGGDWGANCFFDYRTNSSMVYYMGSNKRRNVTGSDATYGFPGVKVQNITFNRKNINLAFATDSNVYRTINLTAATPSWIRIDSLNKKIMDIHSSVADSNRLYFITNDAKIYVSNNALNATPAFTMYTLPNATNSLAKITSVKTNPNSLYITCNTKVYHSTNNGASWTDITYNLPSVNHIGILSDEYLLTDELIFIGSNNSVYYKRLNEVNWTLYSNNLPSRTTLSDLSIYNDGTANTLLRASLYGRGMWETPISSLNTLSALFTADKQNICMDSVVHFNDASTGIATTWSWTFPGGTPASSSLRNPTVYYHNAGIYPVSLSVSDGTNNSSLTKPNLISTLGISLPVNEGLENGFPPSQWTIIDDSADSYIWSIANGYGGYGTSSNSMLYDNYSNNAVGTKDEIRSSPINLSAYATAKLTFDIAYAFYGALYADSLAVKISTDCGNSFSTVYYNGGLSLSTASTTNYYTPAASEWRTDTINLNSFLGQSIIVSFQNINDYGNVLYIDNIKINGTVAANAGNDKTICKGSTAQLGTAAIPGISYNWMPTTGLNSAIVSNPIATAITTTAYELTATHIQSGISKKDTVIVNVIPIPPAPHITQHADTLVSDAISGNQWYNLASGSILNATSSKYIPQQSGSYFVIVTINGCSSDSSNILIYTITGLNDATGNQKISVYPNPVKNELVIESDLNTAQIIEVVNMVGQPIYTSNLLKKKIIDVSGFPKGMYVLKLISAKEIRVIKFIKQ
ncbi:MAG: T9SS type A sorting domain-containing protein [Bacteroidetes bacterium]|nr:T9SS type A sorting domain-containing protein [Bacteroidota bacterium]